MGKREWFGAAIAAFGVGCGEDRSVDAKNQDIKDAKVEKAPEEILGQDEVIDEELFVPEEPARIPTKSASEAGRGNVESGNEERWKEEKGKEDVEIESMAFRNILMEEADGIKPGDWMGDEYDKEVARLKKKLSKELSEHKFNNSLEQLHRFFATPKDEEKRKKEEEKGVICLLKATEDGKFFVNKEYKEQVKKFAEKYGAQYGVPVEVIYGVMGIENAGKHDPRKNTADGAYGIMQVQPGVVKHLAEMKFNGEDWKGVSVADLEGNIRAGTAYLEFLNKRYGGQWWAPLMAYNAGPAAFERDMASFSDGSLAGRAKLRGDIRDLKKQIKEKKNEKEVDEEAVSLLEEQLKAKQEEFSVQNEHLDQLRAGVVKGDGWKAFFSDKNLWWACSRFGGTLYANSNARYSVEAMYLSKPMHEIMQSQGGEVKLTPLTSEMK